MSTYDFHEIEARWQRTWDDDGIYRGPNPGDAAFADTQLQMSLVGGSLEDDRM